MKKKLIILTFIIGALFITGCTKKEGNKEEEPKTVATKLVKLFESEIKKSKNIENVAKKIAESDIIVPQTQTFNVEAGEYLSGFVTEIKGYKKVVGITPMISTIPFIAYVFEVENPKEFVKTLKDNAQLNWNICVEADEMKTTIVDNYVFFIMSPKNFEE